MLIHNIVRSGGNCMAGIVLIVALAPVGRCQTAPAAGSGAAPTNVQAEVQVQNQKSLRQLRAEVDQAEENFFAVFNSINSDDEYDVKCAYETGLGSRRKQHVCTPRFARKIKADSTSRMMNEGQWDAPSPPGSRMQKKKELMRQEISDLLSTDTAFRAVFTDYANAKRAYESAHDKQ
jgi:hypothetical protein